MADILIDKNATSLDISDAFDGYSRVVIKTGETDDSGNDIAYIAGNTSGRTLEVDCPWGNQTVANNILAKIEGWAYQPMVADGATINPAFELGDSVVVNNVFSGIYSSKVKFSKLFTADIEAPFDKEINHEYQFESSQERRFTRKLNDAVARLNFYADSIEAKVDKESAGTTFGWRIDEDSWDVFNQGGTLFSINAGGAYVKGEVQAGSGKIGGFNIGARGLWNNQSSFGGQEQTGVYIGTDGIQLGTKFRVDAQGNLYASSGHFDGDVYASNIKYGTGSGGQNYGYLPGGAISQYSLDTSQFAQGVRNSLGYANLFNSATIQGSGNYPSYFRATTLSAEQGMLSPEYWVYDAQNNAAGSLKGHTHLVTVNGNTVTIGAPDFSGTPHSFNIAGTATVQSTVVNGTPTYQSSYNRYAVPVKVTLSNGATSTTTLYVNASAAYNAGYNAGHSAGYEDAKDDCVVGYYYTSSWGSNNYYVIFANIGGERAADASVYVDNNGHIND